MTGSGDTGGIWVQIRPGPGSERESYETVIFGRGVEHSRFNWKPKGIGGASLHEIGMMTPEDAGFYMGAPAGIKGLIDAAGPIEVELPDGDVCGMNWEALSPNGVVRRRPANTVLSDLEFPIKMAVVTAGKRKSSRLVDSLRNALSSYIENRAVEIDELQVDRIEDVGPLLSSKHYDVVHFSAPTAVRNRRPYTVFGDEIVDTRLVFDSAFAAKPRLAFFQGLSNDPAECISGLRMSSQNATNFGTGCIVSATAEDDDAADEFVVNTYRNAFSKDVTWSAAGQEWPTQRRSRFMTSVIAPPKRRSLLELKSAMAMESYRGEAMFSDFRNLEEQAGVLDLPIQARDLFTHRKQVTAWAGVDFPDLTAQLFELSETNRKLEEPLRAAVDQIRIDKKKPDTERYPVGNFCHCTEGTDDWIAIPENRTVTGPPPGRQLEFHFWIDPIKGGIRTIAADVFSPKEGTVYPLQFKARLWTESALIRVRNEESAIEVPETGASSRARFAFDKVPDHADIEMFLFLQHGATLIAAYRVFARFREQSIVDDSAQLIVQIFSSSDFFRFRDKPPSSALTILFDKADDGTLRVFTLDAANRPWARLGIHESDLTGINRETYRQLTKLALEAARSERMGESINISDMSLRGLAERGHVLLQDLFSVDAEEQANTFIKRVLRLEPGSRLTIATNDKTSRLIVPWSLLYLDHGFRHFPYTVKLDSFLGYRYNLVVRPSIAFGAANAEPHKPVRMAAAWLSRPETKQLESTLETARQSNQITYQRVRASNYGLPDLTNGEFDLIHFYCHGHTRFPDAFQPQDFVQLLQEHIQSVGPPTAEAAETELAQFLDKVKDAVDSLMYLDGGFVYRSDLAESLGNLNGAPIVLLSMCESAQVTASGVGFVTLFLRRGARAAIGTEGPTLWTLGRDLDTLVIEQLLRGESIGDALYEAKKEIAKGNPLALIYSLWGDRDARIAANPKTTVAEEK